MARHSAYDRRSYSEAASNSVDQSSTTNKEEGQLRAADVEQEGRASRRTAVPLLLLLLGHLGLDYVLVREPL